MTLNAVTQHRAASSIPPVFDLNSCPSPFSEEFKDFALKHPEYAKLFTTYLELQRSQWLAETEASCTPAPKTPASPEKTSLPRNKVCPQDTEEDHSSVSDKKED